MKFRTSRFGEIEIPDDTVIDLKDGILGFPRERTYVLLEHDTEDTPFKWLQSVENADLAFVVVDPTELVGQYHFDLEDDVVDELKSDRPEDYIPMVIVNIPREDPIRMTANLRGPIVVNCKTRHGRQIVLKNEAYAFDHSVFQKPETDGEAANRPEPAHAPA